MVNSKTHHQLVLPEDFSELNGGLEVSSKNKNKIENLMTLFY